MYSYVDVNEALKGVVDYLQSIENVWNTPRTLKLYDVFFHGGEVIEKYPLVTANYSEDDLFTEFCEDSYNNFTAWMMENDIEDCRDYIGRTSSFYLTKIHDDNMMYVLNNLFDAVSGNFTGVDIDENCKMIPYTATEYYTEAELIEEYQPDMEYIACGEFLADVKGYLSDAVEIASYIDSFMEDQIDNFEIYIEALNEEAQEQADQEAAEEKAFTVLYQNAITDITAAIENVIRETGCTISEARRITNKSLDLVTV